MYFIVQSSGLHLHKDPLRVPVDIAAAHPLCIKCKHYIAPNNSFNLSPKNGFCKLSGMMHVVDGTVEYEKLQDYRPYVCKGQYFEKLPIVLLSKNIQKEDT